MWWRNRIFFGESNGVLTLSDIGWAVEPQTLNAVDGYLLAGNAIPGCGGDLTFGGDPSTITDLTVTFRLVNSTGVFPCRTVPTAMPADKAAFGVLPAGSVILVSGYILTGLGNIWLEGCTDTVSPGANFGIQPKSWLRLTPAPVP